MSFFGPAAEALCRDELNSNLQDGTSHNNISRSKKNFTVIQKFFFHDSILTTRIFSGTIIIDFHFTMKFLKYYIFKFKK